MRPLTRFVVVAVLLLASAFVFDLLRPTRADLRVFDPVRVARLDTDMWRSYYDRRPVRLHLQMTALLREQFHLSAARASVTAFRAARAAFVFKRGRTRSDYERARPALRAYFRDLRRASTTPFDIDSAAATELEWWIVHRERGRHAGGDLARAVAVAAAVLYRTEPARLRPYGEERALAMDLRDGRQAAGGLTPTDWAAIDEHLERSWRSLRDSVRTP